MRPNGRFTSLLMENIEMLKRDSESLNKYQDSDGDGYRDDYDYTFSIRSRPDHKINLIVDKKPLYSYREWTQRKKRRRSLFNQQQETIRRAHERRNLSNSHGGHTPVHQSGIRHGFQPPMQVDLRYQSPSLYNLPEYGTPRVPPTGGVDPTSSTDIAHGFAYQEGKSESSLMYLGEEIASAPSLSHIAAIMGGILGFVSPELGVMEALPGTMAGMTEAQVKLLKALMAAGLGDIIGNLVSGDDPKVPLDSASPEDVKEQIVINLNNTPSLLEIKTSTTPTSELVGHSTMVLDEEAFESHQKILYVHKYTYANGEEKQKYSGRIYYKGKWYASDIFDDVAKAREWLDNKWALVQTTPEEPTPEEPTPEEDFQRDEDELDKFNEDIINEENPPEDPPDEPMPEKPIGTGDTDPFYGSELIDTITDETTEIVVYISRRSDIYVGGRLTPQYLAYLVFRGDYEMSPSFTSEAEARAWANGQINRIKSLIGDAQDTVDSVGDSHTIHTRPHPDRHGSGGGVLDPNLGGIGGAIGSVVGGVFGGWG